MACINGVDTKTGKPCVDTRGLILNQSNKKAVEENIGVRKNKHGYQKLPGASTGPNKSMGIPISGGSGDRLPARYDFIKGDMDNANKETRSSFQDDMNSRNSNNMADGMSWNRAGKDGMGGIAYGYKKGGSVMKGKMLRNAKGSRRSL